MEEDKITKYIFFIIILFFINFKILAITPTNILEFKNAFIYNYSSFYLENDSSKYDQSFSSNFNEKLNANFIQGGSVDENTTYSFEIDVHKGDYYFINRIKDFIKIKPIVYRNIELKEIKIVYYNNIPYLSCFFMKIYEDKTKLMFKVLLSINFENKYEYVLCRFYDNKSSNVIYFNKTISEVMNSITYKRK